MRLVLKALEDGYRCQFIRAQDLSDETYASLSRIVPLDRTKIRAVRERGMTLQELARTTGMSAMTVHRILHREA